MPRSLVTRNPATETGAATMVGATRPSTSRTLTPMLKAMLRSSGFRGRRAARLLANDDEDRLGRFHGIEVDLDLEIPEIHLVRWIILRVAFDRERLVRLVGPKRALAPESQEKGPDHIEADGASQLRCVRLLTHEAESLTERALDEVEEQPRTDEPPSGVGAECAGRGDGDAESALKADAVDEAVAHHVGVLAVGEGRGDVERATYQRALPRRRLEDSALQLRPCVHTHQVAVSRHKPSRRRAGGDRIAHLDPRRVQRAVNFCALKQRGG